MHRSMIVNEFSRGRLHWHFSRSHDVRVRSPWVEHKDGHTTRELAPLKKTIYSLIDLREILFGCNQRYLAFCQPRRSQRRRA